MISREDSIYILFHEVCRRVPYGKSDDRTYKVELHKVVSKFCEGRDLIDLEALVPDLVKHVRNFYEPDLRDLP